MFTQKKPRICLKHSLTRRKREKKELVYWFGFFCVAYATIQAKLPFVTIIKLKQNQYLGIKGDLLFMNMSYLWSAKH